MEKDNKIQDINVIQEKIQEDLEEMFEENKTEKASSMSLIKRGIWMVLGVVIIGMGSGMFRLVDWGLDPFSCIVDGVHLVSGISFGNIQLIYNVLLFVPILFLCRKSIGIGTFVNMVGVGYVSDATLFLVQDVLGYTPGVVGKIVIMISFLILFALGIALYMEAKFGTAPYDTLGDVIEEKTHGKISFKLARIILDVSSVIVGVVLGLIKGKMVFGICTLLLALGTGYISGTIRKIICKNKQGQI